jgi:hypothetical protein
MPPFVSKLRLGCKMGTKVSTHPSAQPATIEVMRRFVGVLLLGLGLPLFPVGGRLIFLGIMVSHEPMSVLFLWMGIVAACAGLLISCAGICLLYDRNEPISSGQKRRFSEYRRCSNRGVCEEYWLKRCVHCGRLLE